MPTVYTNRGDFFYGIMKDALDDLKDYNSKVTIADAPSKDYPYVLFFLEDEKYTYEQHEGQLITKGRGEVEFNIFCEFVVKANKASEDTIRTTANEWTDEIEACLDDISLKKRYVHKVDGTDKYIIHVKKIKINNIIKALAAENNKVGTIYINGAIEFDKNFILS